MPEQSRNQGAERLPIKLIMPKQGTERRVPGGGPKPIPFRPVDDAFRLNLSNQVSALQATLLPQIRETGAAPLRVRLISKAMAKSHRPEHLFSPETCPIVGAGRLGELFVKATPGGLERLQHIIKTNHAERMIKELSCIEAIEIVTPSYRRRGLEAVEVLRRSPRGKAGFITKVRLFNFGADEDQPKFVSNFLDLCKRRSIPIDTSGYTPSSYIFSTECKNTEDVDALSKVIGVRSISGMPVVRTLHPKMSQPSPFPHLLRRSDVTGDVPVVVVVDSGISPNIPDLQPWVAGRASTVAKPYRNYEHGTFVAGLICWGNALNPGVGGIDSNPCAVFDLQVLPNDDPSKGDTAALLEQEFLISLESALQNHANDFKVWNLSLGTDTPCSQDEFSELAEELDNLQERYQVSFVISAGNYTSLPLLDYPRTPQQIQDGRITTPADSVLGITVGSVSQVDYSHRGPRKHHPSAFSRHGAGPNHIIKPDLVHYGGTCTVDRSQEDGIRSITSSGIAQNLGTSFAAPLVSRTLAQIYHQITPTPSPVMARALLTHHARDPRSGNRVPDGDENFFGFGLPAPVPYCLECSPYTSTLVFDDVLRPGYFLEWDDFPFPPSLRHDGKYFGEIWMTLALAPSRGARWGSEYCETHIDAHFGVYRNKVARDSGEVTTVFKGLVPPEHKNPGLLYESYQIEKLRKWAPVRTYYGNLGENGERGERWRLKLQLLTRHNNESEEAIRPQPFSLIVTVSDPLKKAPVYDEMARITLNRFQSQNLAVRAAARIRGRSQE
jgi:hypothetical protein